MRGQTRQRPVANGGYPSVSPHGSRIGFQPSWSPDGRQLAVQSGDVKTHAGHIWIVDAATGPHIDEVPAWFPDGKRIAFQSDRTGRMEVWVMNVDGSAQHQVTK